MATARDIESAERNLHELRVEEWSDLALAATVVAASLVATVAYPAFVAPLFLGGVVVAVLAGRAFFRRLDLVDTLMLDRDAYAIPEIRRQANRAASMESRRELAAAIGQRLTPVPGYPLNPRVAAVADDLRSLADELEDETLSLEPGCAVLCVQLLKYGDANPLINELITIQELRSRILQVRAGFTSTAVAA
jgi:hypothetical protein